MTDPTDPTDPADPTHPQGRPAERPRVVFDCMLFLQGAARETGTAAACLRLAEQGHVELLLSPEVVREIRDVLTRPKILRKFPSLAREPLDDRLERWARHGRLVADVPHQVSYPRDPKDEKYLNLAIAAEARYLVSWDNDLLDIARIEAPEARDLRDRFPTLRIEDPVAFLREIEPALGIERTPRIEQLEPTPEPARERDERDLEPELEP